ncbi:MAG: cytochrome P450 [Scytonematopsis contorta HA4267-MV1]|jgi:cytochrome P450|nr:cytochrome P450 [Scytonematopsis contorta HA4267-MV1]
MTINKSQIIEQSPSRKVAQGESFLKFKRASNIETFPQTFAEYVNSYGEIYYWPTGGFHVITKAEDARNILSNSNFSADRSAFFISRMPNVDLSLISDFFSIIQKMMVMSDGKQHQMRRKTAHMGISDRWVSSFEPATRKIVKQLLDDVAQNKEIEFVTQVAQVLPSTVLAELFCIPEEEREFFRSCSNTMTAFFGGAVEYTNEVAVETNQAALNIGEYFSAIIQKRRKNPQDDFISGIIAAQEQFNMSEEEIIAQATMMLVAGQVTTTDQICNNLFLLLNNREILQGVKANPELLPNALEEFKRIDPAVTFLFRAAVADEVINGQLIKAGETVFISNHCVNRDMKESEAPNQIRINRQDISHFAYGHGAHYCIGSRLGRLQISELFASMINRFPNLRLSPDNPPERDHYSLAFSGFKTLPLIL